MRDDFDGLSRDLQRQIDGAFDGALESRYPSKYPSTKQHKLTPQDAEPAGGFILEEEEAPGGFILPTKTVDGIVTEVPSEQDLIPFDLIPTALQILDLQPDDEEVLQVFRNAAGGWSTLEKPESGFEQGNDNLKSQGGAVTRKDWRAVCAVIIGDDPNVDTEGEIPGGFVVEKEDMSTSRPMSSMLEEEFDEEEEQDDDDDEDEYQGSLSSLSSEQDGDSDADEYHEGRSDSKSKSESKDRNSKDPRTSIPPGGPTQRQKQAALDAFALFFPATPPLTDTDLCTKRIRFKDIVRVADTLKEKIKAEEITEMLSFFSDSPDQSVSLDDFTRMMILARLA
ncbi:hypothetical protein K439DRAFT_1635236 [Ramaria rubella]|nr:hypothetical protein K439DRAFT_1635236 [Ramaria rubella]